MAVDWRPTSYGAAALATLRQIVREHKGNDPMSTVTLLVPNNLAGIVARRTLAQGLHEDGNGVAGILLSTLPRLAEQLGAAALRPRRPATTAVVSAAWREALDSGPSIFDPVKDHSATVRALVSAHRELRDLSDEGLDGVAAASTLASELVRLHRRVVAALRPGWYDQADLLATAADGLAEAPDSVLGQPVLYLPQQLTRGEARLALVLSEGTSLTVVLALTGVERADRAVLRSLAPLGVEAHRGERPRTATRVFSASDSDDEVRCVVRDLASTLRETPAARVAVLYGSALPYARLLAEHLNAAGIAFNGPGTRPVIERALGRGFLDILALADADMPRADFFTAVSEAPLRTSEGVRVPAARWERISRSAAVLSGDDWDVRLSAHSAAIAADLAAVENSDDPSPSAIDGLRRERDSVESLRGFATRLRARLQEGQRLGSWPDLSRWAISLFHDLYGDAQALAQLPAEEQYAAVAVESALDGLATLDSFEPVAELDRLVSTLSLDLEASLPRVGRFGDGVLVAPLSASVGLDADRVYVLGLAEDGYPGRLAEDPLLLERVRQSSGGELASYRDRLDAKHRHLLAAFDAAPVVAASFPRGDLRRSTGRLPSRWLLPTLQKLSADPDLAAADWQTATSPDIGGSPSYARSLVAAAFPASEQEWRTQAAARQLPLEDPIVAAARVMVVDRASSRFTRFDGNVSGSSGLPDFADGIRRISPTALESYASCPHAYFMERLLRVQPVEQPEAILVISPLDIGNLIHQSMDRFIKEFADSLPGYGETWTPAQRRRLREITLALAGDYESRGTTGHRSLWLAERDRIVADLDFMLDNDDARRRERSARVLRSELRFGFEGTDPVDVLVPRGVVRFRGSADKVDEQADRTLVVVDIKTGGTSRFVAIKKDPIAAGTKLQLPVYARAARQLLHADRAEAAYWFVRQGKRGWIEVALTDELDAIFTAAVATLTESIADGLFPAKAPEIPDFLWVQCPYCNPDRLGHGEARGRWESKRTDPVLRGLVRLVDPAALEGDEA